MSAEAKAPETSPTKRGRDTDGAKAAPAADVDAAVLKQVEYYFGDSNIVRDKFLKQRIAESAEGWVDMAVLLKFNRLNTILASGGVDGDAERLAAIANALKPSAVVEVNEEKNKLRRVHPVPDHYSAKGRTVYAKGFPKDHTLDQVRVPFVAFGDVKRVGMRRYQGAFKGSVFVEFSTEDEAQKCAAELKQYEGKDLVRVLMMNDYFKVKKEERQARNEAKEAKRAQSGAGTGEGEGAADGADGKKALVAADGEKFKREKTPDVLLYLEDIGAEEDRFVLKEYLSGYGVVKFVDFDEEDHSAVIRFEAAAGAAAALAAVQADMKKEKREINVGAASVLKGEAEESYWEKVWEMHLARWKKIQERERGGGRRGGRGGRGRGRGRGKRQRR